LSVLQRKRESLDADHAGWRDPLMIIE